MDTRLMEGNTEIVSTLSLARADDDLIVISEEVKGILTEDSICLYSSVLIDKGEGVCLTLFKDLPKILCSAKFLTEANYNEYVKTGMAYDELFSLFNMSYISVANRFFQRELIHHTDYEDLKTALRFALDILKDIPFQEGYEIVDKQEAEYTVNFLLDEFNRLENKLGVFPDYYCHCYFIDIE